MENRLSKYNNLAYTYIFAIGIINDFFGIDQKKRKLESVEKEDDLDTGMAKLIDEAAKIRIQRLQYAIAIKV